jgi:hypothetical protein
LPLDIEHIFYYYLTNGLTIAANSNKPDKETNMPDILPEVTIKAAPDKPIIPNTGRLKSPPKREMGLKDV